MNPKDFFAELKRRNVVRMAGLYLVGAWLLVQVAGTVLPMFGAPDWIARSIVILLAIGFVPAVIFSWVFELTPQGLKRDEDVRPEESIAPQTGRRMNRLIIAVLVFALGYFAVDKFVLAPRWAATPDDSPSAVNKKSIAVLPFENLSRDPDNAYFVDGIQDEILTRLAKISALKVISRTSTMRYASRPDDLREIAKQLGVANVLEGSVQRAAGAVRVNVQLIEAKSDSHLWAESYDRDIKNIFSVESEVAQNVADALKAKLLPAESARIANVSTKNPQAYDRFLEAEYFVNQIDSRAAKDPADVVRKAAELYESAIAADPDFALAYAGLAYLKISGYWRSIDPSPETLKAAQAAATRALALQPNLPEAHLAMGYVHYWGHRDFAAALTEFAAARASLPNDSNVLKSIAFVHRRQGNLLDSIQELEQAAVLDPRDMTLPREIGITLGCLRRYAEAEAAFDRCLALSPDNIETYLYRAVAFQMNGDFTAASRALTAIPAGYDPLGEVSVTRFNLALAMRQPDAALAAIVRAPALLNDTMDEILIPVTMLRGRALAVKGETGPARVAFLEAQQALEGQLRDSREPAGVESYLSIIFAGLGKKEEALAAGRRATELLPLSQDVLGGSLYLGQLAAVEAKVGETESALSHLEQLLAAPAGWVVSAASLRFDPAWDSLRKDSRFQKLITAGAIVPGAGVKP